jgi:soluble lytic murein transglycosylase-like protein
MWASRWPQSAQFAPIILEASAEYQVDPNLVAAVMAYESGFNPAAYSRARAMGLMQVMPFHACASWDPHDNIYCGVYILVNYFERANGDWRAALAYYNAGETGATKYGRGWDYADFVLNLLKQSQLFSR